MALSLLVGQVGAEAPVLARVLAVTSDRVTLGVAGDSEEASRPLIVRIGQDGLPPGIAAGSLVRVWTTGPISSQDSEPREARLVPLDSDLGGRDRTGVRARLMYGSQRGLGGGFGGGKGGR